MGHFSNALKSAMTEMRWTQTVLAGRLKTITQQTLSRYLTTDDLPKLVTLEEICRQFSQHWREEITAAFLTDQTPASMGDTIKVITIHEGIEQPARYEVNRAPEDSELRKSLRKLELWAMEDPSVETVVVSLAEGYDNRRKSVRYHVRDETNAEAEMQEDLAEAEKRIAAQEEAKQRKRGKKS